LQEDERAQNLFSKALEIAPDSALAACEMGDYLDLVTSQTSILNPKPYTLNPEP
jgi:hypothetical protein